MLRSHAQLLHELLDMRNLAFRDLSIGLGQLAHRDKHRLEENRLTQRVLQRVHPAGAIRPHAIKKSPDEQPEQRSEESKKVITRNDADELEQGNSKMKNKPQPRRTLYRPRRCIFPPTTANILAIRHQRKCGLID